MSQSPPPLPPMMDYGNYPPNQKPPAQGKAIASLVLGICSSVFWLCPIVGIVVSIVGLVLGAQSRRECPSGMATAGFVLSIIGLILTTINGAWGAYLGFTGQHGLVNSSGGI